MRYGTAVIRLAITLMLVATSRGDLSSQATSATAERVYTLEATMLGYRGVGGEIDGVRNPTLWARTGRDGSHHIVNGELMVHDIALENAGVKSPQILDKRRDAPASRSRRRTATPTTARFLATAGRDGRPARGVGRTATRSRKVNAPAANGQPLNLDFETGTLQNWTAAGNAFDGRQGRGDRRPSTRRRPGIRGPTGSAAPSGGSARERLAVLRAVSRDSTVRQLPRVRRRLQQHARGTGAG